MGAGHDFDSEVVEGPVHLVPFGFHVEAVLVLVDAEAIEEGFEQISAHLVGSVAVEGAGVAQQLQIRKGRLGAVFQPFGGSGQALLHRALLQVGLLKLLAKLRDVDDSTSGEVDQAILLRDEFCQLLSECVLGFLVSFEECVDSVSDELAHGVDHRRIEALPADRLDDLLLENLGVRNELVTGSV